jgi:hypothetical protein
MTDKTGGPAFPKTPFIEVGIPQNGMTLRDYFAAKAMQVVKCSDYKTTAEFCYSLADAMLKAREQ